MLKHHDERPEFPDEAIWRSGGAYLITAQAIKHTSVPSKGSTEAITNRWVSATYAPPI